MDINYNPPLEDDVECEYLKQNFVFCLKQKALKDEVPYKRRCDVNFLPWFGLECPTKYEELRNPDNLRKLFITEKLLDKNPNRKYTKRVLIQK